MKVVTGSWAVFACYSAACRPPTSGGTGGSSPGKAASALPRGAPKLTNGHSLSKSKSGYQIRNADGKVVARGKTLSSLKKSYAKSASSESALPEVQPKASELFTPRKLSRAQAEAEIDEIVRDSENQGYYPDERDASMWIDALNTARLTGKEVTYDAGFYREETVRPDDDTWHTKLDYEASFPADTIAAWLGKNIRG